jgi:hypothetical protein
VFLQKGKKTRRWLGGRDSGLSRGLGGQMKNNQAVAFF